MGKKIGLWDLVFMDVAALFGIRWIAKSTAESFGLGLGAIPIWILATFIFFVPFALICAELASTYPKDGGLFQWVKEAYGEKYGFMVAWLNWTCRIFWYTGFLTFLIINISYAINEPALADDKLFVMGLSLVIFWVLSVLSTKGMTFGKIFTRVGALGSTIPAILLVVMAFAAVLFGSYPVASTYTAETLMPKLNMDSLSAISSVLFALAGAEVTANFVTEMENPKRDFPRAIFIAAAIVSGLYVLGSIAITMIVPPAEITASQGILVGLAAVSSYLGFGTWFIQLVAFGIALSIIGAIILYIASPIKMLFGSVQPGIFPASLTKVNEKNIPERAVYFQACIVTVLVLALSLIPSVDAIYNILVTMTALTTLFPYAMLFAAYIRLRTDRPDEVRPFEMAHHNETAKTIARVVLGVVLLGVVLSLAPVMKTIEENIVYEIEMIGGAAVVIVSGLLLWKRFVQKTGFTE